MDMMKFQLLPYIIPCYSWQGQGREFRNEIDSLAAEETAEKLTIYIYLSKYWQLPTLYEYLLYNNKTRTYRHFHHIEWKLEPKNFNGLL